MFVKAWQTVSMLARLLVFTKAPVKISRVPTGIGLISQSALTAASACRFAQ
jgi:hypothetical protein